MTCQGRRALPGALEHGPSFGTAGGSRRAGLQRPAQLQAPDGPSALTADGSRRTPALRTAPGSPSAGAPRSCREQSFSTADSSRSPAGWGRARRWALPAEGHRCPAPNLLHASVPPSAAPSRQPCAAAASLRSTGEDAERQPPNAASRLSRGAGRELPSGLGGCLSSEDRDLQPWPVPGCSGVYRP